tara:strand:- start:25036 stop:25248 length:213 start_codon:yes stop_codon:yes gene_type:complete
MHIKLTGNGPAAAPVLINTNKVLAYTTHYTVTDSPSSPTYSEVVFEIGTPASSGIYVKETVEEILALINK